MPIYRMQCAFAMDSLLPRDAMCITPHFRDAGIGTDPDALCEDLADALTAWWGIAGGVTVTAYNAEGPPPHYPLGYGQNNPTGLPSAACPRELAICLSYFSERNQPRHRGRLFIPMAVLGAGTVGVAYGARPNTVTMNKAGELATAFADLGGVDVDWIVWSRVDGEARPVSNWWVDNEWDTVRSRGLRGDARVAGTLSE